MKFISLFFLLVIILMVNVIASAKVGKFKSYSRPVIDTIIKLDTIKDKKLLKGKKSAPNTAAKNAAAKTDTTKKKAAA